MLGPYQICMRFPLRKSQRVLATAILSTSGCSWHVPGLELRRPDQERVAAVPKVLVHLHLRPAARWLQQEDVKQASQEVSGGE